MRKAIIVCCCMLLTSSCSHSNYSDDSYAHNNSEITNIYDHYSKFSTKRITSDGATFGYFEDTSEDIINFAEKFIVENGYNSSDFRFELIDDSYISGYEDYHFSKPGYCVMELSGEIEVGYFLLDSNGVFEQHNLLSSSSFIKNYKNPKYDISDDKILKLFGTKVKDEIKFAKESIYIDESSVITPCWKLSTNNRTYIYIDTQTGEEIYRITLFDDTMDQKTFDEYKYHIDLEISETLDALKSKKINREEKIKKVKNLFDKLKSDGYILNYNMNTNNEEASVEYFYGFDSSLDTLIIKLECD